MLLNNNKVFDPTRLGDLSMISCFSPSFLFLARFRFLRYFVVLQFYQCALMLHFVFSGRLQCVPDQKVHISNTALLSQYETFDSEASCCD